MNVEPTELQQGILLNWEKELNEYINLCNDPNATEEQKRATYIKILRYQSKLEEMKIDYMGVIIHKTQTLQQGLQNNFDAIMEKFNTICNNTSEYTEEEIAKVSIELHYLSQKLEEVNDIMKKFNIPNMNFQEEQSENSSLKK